MRVLSLSLNEYNTKGGGIDSGYGMDSVTNGIVGVLKETNAQTSVFRESNITLILDKSRTWASPSLSLIQINFYVTPL